MTPPSAELSTRYLTATASTDVSALNAPVASYNAMMINSATRMMTISMTTPRAARTAALVARIRVALQGDAGLIASIDACDHSQRNDAVPKGYAGK